MSSWNGDRGIAVLSQRLDIGLVDMLRLHGHQLMDIQMVVARGFQLIGIGPVDLHRLQRDKVAGIVGIVKTRSAPVLYEVLVNLHRGHADQIALADMRIAVMNEHVHIVFFDVDRKIGEFTPVIHILDSHLFNGGEVSSVRREPEMSKTFLSVELTLKGHGSRFTNQFEFDIALSGKRVDLAFFDVETAAPVMVIVPRFQLETQLVVRGGGKPCAFAQTRIRHDIEMRKIDIGKDHRLDIQVHNGLLGFQIRHVLVQLTELHIRRHLQLILEMHPHGRLCGGSQLKIQLIEIERIDLRFGTRLIQIIFLVAGSLAAPGRVAPG